MKEKDILNAINNSPECMGVGGQFFRHQFCPDAKTAIDQLKKAEAGIGDPYAVTAYGYWAIRKNGWLYLFGEDGRGEIQSLAFWEDAGGMRYLPIAFRFRVTERDC